MARSLLLPLAWALAFLVMAVVAVPDAPTLTTSSTTTSSIKVTWNVPNGNGFDVDMYHIFIVNTDGLTVIDVDVTATEYTLTGLTGGREYDFQVKAHNEEGWGSYSATLTAYTNNDVPDAPYRLYAEVTDTPTINGGWKAPDNHGTTILSYEVEARNCGPFLGEYRTECSAAGATVVNVGPVEYYEGTNILQHNSEYWMRVRAYNKVGWGAWSDFYKLVTPIASAEAVVMQCSGATSTTLTVTWSEPDANGGAIDQYRVTVQYPDYTQQVLYYTSEKAVFDALSPATTYKFKAEAHNENGWGQQGSWTSCTTAPGIPDPINLYPKSQADQSLTWEWDEPEYYGAAITKYESQFRLCDFDPEKADSVTGETASHSADTRTFTRDGLEYNTTYALKVRAQNSAGWGDYSDWVCQTTLIALPDPPSPYLAAITLQWDQPDAHGGYISKYEVQTREIGSTTEIYGDEVTDTEYSRSNLGRTKSYQVRARALNEAGFSEWSEWFTISNKLQESAECDAGISLSYSSLTLALTLVLATLLPLLL
eukprot:TRINITY_DN7650_c0_g1::TRINITY_DN7650_c0_g1_i1::g.18509::m.18509 TRINITY_DN7650_c0_g1::TRINITY_DN7650_c0_g1_i1::g.18509  ORF type:complete len:538 (+),score=129.73,sp/Q8BX90/FND3A_MOUSE/23.99/8e-20,sp/Q8BX90/FND3A_MOUSE/23.59/3e-18,sp/Q8BX90/FND3A_MOUSE/23.99/2e-13,sp/Q8BX90/FND3A_MOUSE/23.40/1e-09,sp/Q8BX90/FND3A_MOUSE/25.00/2e-09,fn3/PF00041.16/4.9e-12,fn3/PF00041.16/4.6e-05,fn3/PF00041.16/3.8e-10,fn3/PF00041.16/5.9e-07,fn3/PF00041.16/1.8e-07,Interfer-bind/PF09294.5/19,Interfer-bind/PF09294.5/4